VERQASAQAGLELTHSDSGETAHQQKVVAFEKGQVVEVSGEKNR
jgi:hypothetical protein